MTPPFATAATNASAVQLAGSPLPTTVRGFEMSSACASAGTTHLPSGLPAAGPSSGFVGGPPVDVVDPDELPPEELPFPLLLPPPLDDDEPPPGVSSSLEQPTAYAPSANTSPRAQASCVVFMRSRLSPAFRVR